MLEMHERKNKTITCFTADSLLQPCQAKAPSPFTFSNTSLLYCFQMLYPSNQQLFLSICSVQLLYGHETLFVQVQYVWISSKKKIRIHINKIYKNPKQKTKKKEIEDLLCWASLKSPQISPCFTSISPFDDWNSSNKKRANNKILSIKNTSHIERNP